MLRTYRTIEFAKEAQKRRMTVQEFALYRRILRNRLDKRLTRKG